MIDLNQIGCPEDCRFRYGEDGYACMCDFEKNPCEIMNDFIIKKISESSQEIIYPIKVPRIPGLKKEARKFRKRKKRKLKEKIKNGDGLSTIERAVLERWKEWYGRE